MYTSGLLVALLGLLPSSIRQEPNWLEDYSKAYHLCQKAEKPLAVFVGLGSKGWNRLSKEGQLSAESMHFLSKNYVCVYIDATREAGEELAVRLEMPNRLGLVISDSKGGVQAFRHEGNLRESDLMRYLRRYADPQRMVVRTESNPSEEAPVTSPRFVERSYPAPIYYSQPSSSFRTGRSC
jgi:hypothetical protein